MTNAIAKISNYNLTAANGRHIRVATMVTLSDGREVRFVEKMTKKEAAHQINVHGLDYCWEHGCYFTECGKLGHGDDYNPEEML